MKNTANLDQKMRFSEVPVFKVYGGDDISVKFINTDKAYKSDSDLKFRPYLSFLNLENQYLLTKDKYFTFNKEKISSGGKEYKPEYVHVVEDCITHFTDDNNNVFCCSGIIVSTGKKHGDRKGNWFIKENSGVLKIKHLGCCKYCSQNYSITVKGKVKCYTDNEIYINNKFIKFENCGLTLYQTKNKHQEIKKFADIKLYKFTEVLRNGIVASNGEERTKLTVNEFVMGRSWLNTTAGMVLVFEDTLHYKDKLIPVADITQVIVKNSKVTHIYYGEKHKICFSKGVIYETCQRTLNNEFLPWTVDNAGIYNLMECGKCLSGSILRKNIKIISFTGDSAIIEYDNIVNEDTSEKKKSIVYLVYGDAPKLIESFDIPETSRVDPSTVTDEELTMTTDGLGTQKWYYQEKLHRISGPAIIMKNGYKAWYYEGQIHRLDGPAVIHSNGDETWYINGKMHRADGPALITKGGNEYWYYEGRLHRLDGPAVTFKSGDKEWYVNGQLHRTDGPAIVCGDGYQEWWIDGVQQNAPIVQKQEEIQQTKPSFDEIMKNPKIEETLSKFTNKKAILNCVDQMRNRYLSLEDVRNAIELFGNILK